MQLISTGTYDAELAKYISGTLDLVYQGMIEDFDTKEKAAHNRKSCPQLLQRNRTDRLSNNAHRQILYKPKQHTLVFSHEN